MGIGCSAFDYVSPTQLTILNSIVPYFSNNLSFLPRTLSLSFASSFQFFLGLGARCNVPLLDIRETLGELQRWHNSCHSDIHQAALAARCSRLTDTRFLGEERRPPPRPRFTIAVLTGLQPPATLHLAHSILVEDRPMSSVPLTSSMRK